MEVRTNEGGWGGLSKGRETISMISAVDFQTRIHLAGDSISLAVLTFTLHGKPAKLNVTIKQVISSQRHSEESLSRRI